MTHPNDWREAEDPARLFLAVWRYVRGVSATRLAAPETVAPELRGELLVALRVSDGHEAVEAFCDALAGRWKDGSNFMAKRTRVSAALTALRAIDEVLLGVHPRSVRPSLSQASSRPDWLDDVEEHRTIKGA